MTTQHATHATHAAPPLTTPPVQPTTYLVGPDGSVMYVARDLRCYEMPGWMASACGGRGAGDVLTVKFTDGVERQCRRLTAAMWGEIVRQVRAMEVAWERAVANGDGGGPRVAAMRADLEKAAERMDVLMGWVGSAG